jgi:hypothetical protein
MRSGANPSGADPTVAADMRGIIRAPGNMTDRAEAHRNSAAAIRM